ncbi:MAG: hypothetical protein GX265_05555 [Mollicutes bacterium]|nr:hypothetical protein [Mollicutes bacterium]
MIFPNDSLTFDLRMWMDEGTTMEQGFNKTFESKIVIAYSPTSIPTHVTFRLPSNPSGLYETSFAGAQWNMKTSSLEISSLNGDLNNIELTNASPVGATNFAEYIMSLDGTNQGNGKLVREISVDFEEADIKDITYYSNIVNDATYPYTWNEDYYWSSTNHDHSSTSTFSFKPSENGPVSLCFYISSEKWYDWANIYIDDMAVGYKTGSYIYCQYLGNLNIDNTVKITYKKDEDTSTGDDRFSFYIVANDILETYGDYRYEGKILITG